MTVNPKIEYKFKYYWGGEDNWYTKGKRWANEQKFPINHFALGFIEWLWRIWVKGRVDMEMTDIDRQVNEIIKTWEEEEKQEPIIEIKASDIEGLDEVRIYAPWSDSNDWNDTSVNYKKWR